MNTTTTRTSVERIWDALNAGGYQPETPRGGRFKALCPVHGDTHRSLSVTHTPGKGMTLMHCFSCQASAADVLATLGLTLADAYDAPLEPRTIGHTHRPARRTPATAAAAPAAPARIAVRPAADLPRTGWVTTVTYDYANSAGVVVERVQRRELTIDGVRHKKFVQQFRQADGTYAWAKPDEFTPVFYRQAAVDAATAAGAPVWICEGEKDAESVVTAGIRTATTNAQGAGSFPQVLLKQLRGPVVIVADRDLAGYTRARDLKTALVARGVTVTVLLPAVLEEKADLSDHLDAGYGISDLVAPTDADLDALIAAAATRKVLTHTIRRDLDEIDTHAADAHATGDLDGTHRAAATYWAARITATWTAHLEQLAGLSDLATAGLTIEGRRAIACIEKATGCAARTLHNLQTAGLTTEGPRA